MCIRPGGWIIKSSIFRAAIILNMVAVWACRLYGIGMGTENMNGKYAVNGKKKEAGGYGASLKEDYRYFYGAGIGMAGRGEAMALESNYCEIDPGVVDKYGIPVLRFNVKYSRLRNQPGKTHEGNFSRDYARDGCCNYLGR